MNDPGVSFWLKLIEGDKSQPGAPVSEADDTLDSNPTQCETVISQDEVDQVIIKAKNMHPYCYRFTYANAREYRDMSTGTLVIPEGFSKIDGNAIDGLSIKQIFFPSTMDDIPEQILNHSYLEHIYVHSRNRRYASFHNGTEIMDIVNKKSINKKGMSH